LITFLNYVRSKNANPCFLLFDERSGVKSKITVAPGTGNPGGSVDLNSNTTLVAGGGV